ncbi:MAG: flagellin, partial [Natronospirillum sp.]
AARNIGDGMSLLQTRSGLASGLTEQVQRMRELAVQANNGTNSPQDRQALNQEFTSLRDSVLEQVGSAVFNGQKLFGGEAQTLQTGPNAGDTTMLPANGLSDSLEEIDFSSLSLAQAGDLGPALTQLDSALGAFTQSQVQDGALSNRLTQQADNLTQRGIDDSQTLSRIQDLDYAKFASDLAQADARNQAQILVQSQANVGRQDVLRLLGG